MARSNEFDSSSISLFAGNANPLLAQEIARHLHVQLGRAEVGRFSDGEVSVELMENVRGRDVFIVQPTCPPANDNLMELLMMTDACRRASAKRVTAVVPYFGYARQDRRPRATRVAIAAKLVANMIASAGVDRLLTVDLHADQIQGFFDIPVDNVYASPVLLGDAWKQKDEKMIVVSPDVGGVVRARALAKRLDDAELAIIDKRRPRPNESKVMNIIGEVEGKSCMLVDDMVDTAGTLCQAAQALKDEGATQGRRLHHPCGVVGCGHRAHLEIGAGRTGGDRHDAAVGCRQGMRAHTAAERRRIARGDHTAHQRRRIGEFAVRRLICLVGGPANWSRCGIAVCCDVNGDDYENLI